MRSGKPKRLLLLLSVFTLSAEWVVAETLANYGAEDTLGAVNRLSSEKLLQAAALVQAGKSCSLGMPLDADVAGYGDRSFRLEAKKISDKPEGKNQLTGIDDRIITHLGLGTQIDGLGHVGINGVHYNGNRVDDILSDRVLVRPKYVGAAQSIINPIAIR